MLNGRETLKHPFRQGGEAACVQVANISMSREGDERSRGEAKDKNQLLLRCITTL